MAKVFGDPPTWDNLRLSPDNWLNQNILWDGTDEDFRREHAAQKVKTGGGPLPRVHAARVRLAPLRDLPGERRRPLRQGELECVVA